jgi:hypothetical protein
MHIPSEQVRAIAERQRQARREASRKAAIAAMRPTR